MNTVGDIFKIETNHVVPTRGRLLIAEPFMCDCMFGRSVIYLTDHSEDGSMGFVLNKAFPLFLNDVLPDFSKLDGIPLHRGGPVGTDTLFYLHTLSHLPGAMAIDDGLYMNGDFNALKKYILDGNPWEGKIRFFLGYSGWTGGQLEDELQRNTWLIGGGAPAGILSVEGMDDELWKDELCRMGGKYKLWSRFPRMPIFN